HIALGAQPLEGVLGLAVHGAAGALRGLRRFEFGDDLVERGGVAVDREGDVLVAERAIALARPAAAGAARTGREVQIDDWNALAPDVVPDVDLRPMQQRMDAQVGAFRQVGIELVPELRRLVLEVPMAGVAARAEHALLGARGFLVAADARDDAGEAVLGDGGAQAQGLAL